QDGEALDEPCDAVTGSNRNEQWGCHHPEEEGENKIGCKEDAEERGPEERSCQKGHQHQRQDDHVVDAGAELNRRRAGGANLGMVNQSLIRPTYRLVHRESQSFMTGVRWRSSERYRPDMPLSPMACREIAAKRD